MVKPRDPAWKDKNRAGALMTRLEQHAKGEIELTQTQINAAKIVLSKVIPDLKSVEHSGKVDHTVTAVEIVRKQP